MKRLLLLLLAILTIAGIAYGDDDDNDNRKCKIKFIYDLGSIWKGAVDAGTYFVGPSGTLYLFPYAFQPPRPTPTPTPVPTITPKPTPTVTPIPTTKPSKQNAYNSCIQCHKSISSKYKFENWTNSLHDKSSHKRAQCSSCHIL